MNTSDVRVQSLGLQHYELLYRQMLAFTEQRDENTADEIWLLEHHPVYTLGKNAKPHHVLNVGDIPLVQVDRGGQVTYHGPGQLIAYLLVDVRRRNLGVRRLVSIMENSLVNLLAEYGVDAYAKSDAPGVYVEGKKIAALGLRIRKGCSYHGLSFNLDMDTRPFNGINPCGYEGLEITQLSDFVVTINPSQIKSDLTKHLLRQLEG